ncbi:MAG: MFS transporter [Alphaproteobacteria bacterium]|nr:MFS transporter [Alphaproteobacteria bacterium]
MPNSKSILAAYGTGWIGGQMFRDVPAMLLLTFMTTALGVPPAVAGASIFVPKLWVVFCDPMVGLWSDRTRSSLGRRRPFLLAGSILCGVTFILLFNVPAFDSGTMRGIYVGAMYTVASTAFSIYSVPYLTMGSELAATPHERTVVMSWRQVGLGGGLILGNAMPMLLVARGGGGESGFSFMGIVLGVLTGVTMFVTFAGTGRARLSETEQPEVALIEQFRLALKNRPFLLLVAGNFLQLVGSAAAYATIVLFTVYHLGKDFTFVSRMTLIMAIMVIVTPALWTIGARRFGKKPTFIFSIVVFIGSYLSFLGSDPEGDLYVYFLCAMLGIFNCGFSLIAFSMLLDTIAHDSATTGLNREGMFSGIWSAMDKTAFAFGALLAGVALQAIGYRESAEGFVPQSPDVIRGIVVIFSCTPAVFAAAAAIVMRFYALDVDRLRSVPRAD